MVRPHKCRLMGDTWPQRLLSCCFFVIISQAPPLVPLLLRAEGVNACVCACMFVHAHTSVWPSCCAFFVYDWWCWCQPSSNPSPSNHRLELWLDAAHTSSCEYDLSPKAWFIQALTRLQSSVAQYHTHIHAHSLTHRSLFEWIYYFVLYQNRKAFNSAALALLQPSSLITEIKLWCDPR